MSNDNADVVLDETVVEELDAPVDDPRATQALPCLVKVPGGLPDLDASLVEVAAQAAEAGRPVRWRVIPGLYFRPKNPKAVKTYTLWKGVQWYLDGTPEDAIAFRKDFDVWVNEWVRRRQGERAGL